MAVETATTTATTVTGVTVTVEVRAFAAARAALGWSQQQATLGAGASVADALAWIAAEAPDAAPVLTRCAVLLDGRRVTEATAVVPDGARLDLLPPFAGG
ncbi:thiamineS protein [Xylanimonas cellulosilytica DSM 15894]|uniref:ThiamineS protein n=1 Tax=Xylanimonas cellulosilytica (strain DSM 15894 / JCM 12276 / CECT 5975 / KCTC 9989 / LMG 20990 / NBRC 107835 / XIL07) TaxID=446471 RepID=D1BT11_XYLCX|nr:MoaD/ThiS family protein [Xylanimonas cellulosilytica]ACZ30853.1 thiamineS protein [Xylanimonas cellulosilytica DSM 15894]